MKVPEENENKGGASRLPVVENSFERASIGQAASFIAASACPGGRSCECTSAVQSDIFFEFARRGHSRPTLCGPRLRKQVVERTRLAE